MMPSMGTIKKANEAKNSGKINPKTALTNAQIAKVLPIQL